jgi:hypothetical protein
MAGKRFGNRLTIIVCRAKMIWKNNEGI